ncbi:hypothetical protein V5O48_015381 [Marasmius crinis-equi]|uniref:Protein kinase domain-containing protein n=1 Tax=Marasmius crinis-equi TaxID=585013 RepID=A0ABR3EUQ3_9AGAR
MHRTTDPHQYHSDGVTHIYNLSGSGTQNNNSTVTNHNYDGDGHIISHGSGDIYANQDGPVKSALDKVKAVHRPVNEQAAQEDLKEVEQRLRADDFLQLDGDEAQKLLDQFHRASEVAPSPTRKRILEKMDQLIKSSNRLPSCLWIQHGVHKLDANPIDESGGYAAVWRGRIGDDPQIMALKIIRRDVEDEVEKLLGTSEFIREILVWRRLQHKNILPFKGAYLFNQKPKQFCLVSPWMEEGNLPNFIKKLPSIGPELQYKLASYSIRPFAK